MLSATIRLFNAVHVEDTYSVKHSEDTFKRTLQSGFLLDSSVPENECLLTEIEKCFDITSSHLNNTFHKSWCTIRSMSKTEHALHQMLHYITAYHAQGRCEHSIKNVYIPHEIINLPVITNDLPLSVISGYTRDQLLKKILTLASGPALGNSTLDDLMSIIIGLDLDIGCFDNIKNRELKARLFDYFNIVPQDPLEYLRFIVIKLTGQTVLIKNKSLLDKIKLSDKDLLDRYLESAPDDLASIFYRFKPIFLAFKTVSSNKNFFNRLRKNAIRMHSPLLEDYLNDVTKNIKNGSLDIEVFRSKLDSSNVFRLVRLLYALKYRSSRNESIVYKVRNGTGWASEFDWDSKNNDLLNQAYHLTWDSLIEKVKKNIEGKRFYIPKNIHYTIPATEKQFTGCIPSGSWVELSKDVVFGVHWKNLDDHEVDLDLSLLTLTGKIGWDSQNQSDDGKVLFSGDIISAPLPEGASELFYIEGKVASPSLIMVNYFNYHVDYPVNAKFVLTQATENQFNSNYVVDLNQLICQADITVDQQQNIFGMVVSFDDFNRIYFSNMNLGAPISASHQPYVINARKYLLGKMLNSIELKDLLVASGGVVLHELPSGEYIDLSPGALSKDTFFEILM